MKSLEIALNTRDYLQQYEYTFISTMYSFQKWNLFLLYTIVVV